MSPSDLNAILQPVSPEDPCGVDLEGANKYDPAFSELERLAQGKAEQQIGSTVVAAEEPDWRIVQRKSLEILARSKDLRVATHLTKSLLRTEGWLGFSQGLSILRGLIEDFWEGLYPRLDPDDDNDPTMRVNILMSIADSAVLAVVRTTPLVVSRTVGRYSLKDLEIAAGDAPADATSGEPPTMTSIEAAVMEVEFSVLESTATAVRDCVTALAGLEAALASRMEAASSPNFARLSALIHKAESFLGSKVAARSPVAVDLGANGDPAAGSNGTAGPVAWTGAIRSRDDVVKALDGITAYYTKHEPSSPVPLFMARCKRLVVMDFVDIVKELVPDALSQVDILRGRPE